jgi:DNA-binding response OmpR family regulator
MQPVKSNPSAKSTPSGKTNFLIVPIKDIPPAGPAGDRGADHPLILVVNDKPDVADSVAEILKQHGYAAIAAYDGKTALETALLIPPELVIAGVGLPGISGIEVVTALKTQLPECKVLLLSGKEAASDLPGSGTDAEHKFEVVSSPVHPIELVAKVSARLKSR